VRGLSGSSGFSCSTKQTRVTGIESGSGGLFQHSARPLGAFLWKAFWIYVSVGPCSFGKVADDRQGRAKSSNDPIFFHA